MNYLVDSDWAVDHLRDIDRVSQRLEALAEDGLGLSIISLAELYRGVFNSANPERNERRLEEFLQDVSIVELDKETCTIYGRERARLQRAGRLISDMDLLIAATALRHDLTLLTNNRRHFERVDGLTIISA
jgi:predicted nucleic acid-binding protein